MRYPAGFEFLSAIAAWAMFAGSLVGAETPPGSAENSKNPDSATVSHRAEMLAAAVPKYDAKQAPAAATPVATPRVATPDRPANEIVRLPNFVVRERRPPKTEDLLVDAELAKIGMNEYIGLEDGLDRGVLNRFTLKSVWNKIPVLGRFPLMNFETNEERGLRLYKEAKMKEEFENLTSLLSIETDSGKNAGQSKKKK